MGERRSTIKPRKIPAQARSRVTVDAIIQATTYILTEVGWDGLTTNAIAERAGVNIGSLYQFFPNKEAVVAELQRLHAVATHAELTKVLEQLKERSTFREVLTLIIEMVVTEHRVAPAVHKAITEELPRTIRRSHEENEQLRGKILEHLKPFIRNVPDPDLAIYMASVAVQSIIHNLTAERPELLDHSSLVAELVALLENYLCRSPESGG